MFWRRWTLDSWLGGARSADGQELLLGQQSVVRGRRGSIVKATEVCTLKRWTLAYVKRVSI